MLALARHCSKSRQESQHIDLGWSIRHQPDIYLFGRSLISQQFAPSTQITCIRGFIFTLVEFVWLFSTVCYQMCPQIACPWGCKVTLAAFIWFLTTVCFQMYPQRACIGGCIVTLVAFVWFFSNMNPREVFVRLQMLPQIVCASGSKVTLVAIVWFFCTVC